MNRTYTVLVTEHKSVLKIKWTKIILRLVPLYYVVFSDLMSLAHPFNNMLR